VVAGCGYAFVETYSRLFGGVDPMLNLAVRIPTTLPLHALTSGIFFVGMSWIFQDRRSGRSFWKDLQDLGKSISREIKQTGLVAYLLVPRALFPKYREGLRRIVGLPYLKGLAFLLLAIGIHTLYFIVAFDLRGVF